MTDMCERRDQITYGQSRRSLLVAEKKTPLVLGFWKALAVSRCLNPDARPVQGGVAEYRMQETIVGGVVTY